MLEEKSSKTLKTLLFLPVVLALVFFSPAIGEEVRVAVTGKNISVSVDAEGYARFTGPDIQYFSEAGEPAIPYRVVTVLLPPAAEPTSVSVKMDRASYDEIPGMWNVRPAEPPSTWDGTRVITAWPEDRTIVDGSDIAVYGRDDLFPGQLLQRITSGSMRGWKLASVPVALYRFNPVRKKLMRLSDSEVCFSYSEKKMAPDSRNTASDRIASENIKDIAINYDSAAPLYADGRKSGPGPGGTTYVILTTSAIQSSLANLDRFTINKQARGFTVQVVTEGDWGGGTGDTAAENIRSWLESNYITLNIEYVLLIGNPNTGTGDVPMKYCYPYSGCPTDYYYADLTGNWDLDGDGRYGEYFGDFGAGGVDRNWDVIVGRIPYYGAIEVVDDVLAKIIDYENTAETDASWRHNVLLPMVPSDGSTPGYHLGEEIKDAVLAPEGWTYHRIYNSTYGLSPPPETVGNTVENTTNAWNAAQFGAIFWWTHGSSTSASGVMDLTHAATLDDAYPGFTFQASCTNSYPEASNNLCYTLLQNGCINTIGATRYSYYWLGQTSFAGRSSNSSFTYEYSARMITDELDSGHALHDLKQAIAPEGYAELWQNYIVFNIYGDPSLGLFTTLVDDDSDSMPDWWEITHFGDISQAAGDDYDSDNLTNLEEYGEGTDPDNPDCDGDGLNDGDEVNTHSTDPLDPDTDDDGAEDGDEVAEGADPNDIDSDDDSLLDGEELNTYGTSPTNADSDGDNWCDVLEISGGSNPNDPNDPPPGSAPDMLRISFQPAGSVRPENYAPSSAAGYSADLGYGWR